MGLEYGHVKYGLQSKNMMKTNPRYFHTASNFQDRTLLENKKYLSI